MYKILTICCLLLIVPACTSSADLEDRMAQMAQRGNFNKVKELVARGVSIESRDAKYGATALMWAAHEGHIDILKYLLAQGAQLEASKPTGQTALWYAAQKGQKEAARILLDKGANFDVVTDDGVTVMMIAQQNNFIDIVSLLNAEIAKKQ